MSLGVDTARSRLRSGVKVTAHLAALPDAVVDFARHVLGGRHCKVKVTATDLYIYVSKTYKSVVTAHLAAVIHAVCRYC